MRILEKYNYSVPEQHYEVKLMDKFFTTTIYEINAPYDADQEYFESRFAKYDYVNLIYIRQGLVTELVENNIYKKLWLFITNSDTVSDKFIEEKKELIKQYNLKNILKQHIGEWKVHFHVNGKDISKIYKNTTLKQSTIKLREELQKKYPMEEIHYYKGYEVNIKY